MNTLHDKININTIKDLRKVYPHHDFYFFKDGKEFRKEPFYHDRIKDFIIMKDHCIFVEML